MKVFDNRTVYIQDPTKYVCIELIPTPVEPYKKPTAKEIIVFWLLFALRWSITISLCGATLLLTFYVAFLTQTGSPVQDLFLGCCLGYACVSAFFPRTFTNTINF